MEWSALFPVRVQSGLMMHRLKIELLDVCFWPILLQKSFLRHGSQILGAIGATIE